MDQLDDLFALSVALYHRDNGTIPVSVLELQL